jgi:hypothetical protein
LGIGHALRGEQVQEHREREGNLKLKVVDVAIVNIVILNWQRPLWECDQDVVAKRSGRDEPVRVVIQHVHGSNARNLSV